MLVALHHEVAPVISIAKILIEWPLVLATLKRHLVAADRLSQQSQRLHQSVAK